MGIKKQLEDSAADAMDIAATCQAEALRDAAAGAPAAVVTDALTSAQAQTDYAVRALTVAGTLEDEERS